jgi:hypothetical protein
MLCANIYLALITYITISGRENKSVKFVFELLILFLK